MFDLDSFLDVFGLGNDSDDDLMAGNGGEPDDVAVPDADSVGIDLDGDGIADVIVSQYLQDLDGDGVADALVTEQQIDTDGDGIFDAVQVDVGIDTDGDGLIDAHSIVTGVDTDGDGIIDYMQTAEDYDNDGLWDSVSEYADTDGDGIWDMAGNDGIALGEVPGYEAFDPDAADLDGITGAPADAMENWHGQETGSSCAVASQEFVLEQLTGKDFEESDLRELAEENGWYDPNGGTAMEDIGNILEHMGLDVEKSQGNSIADVEHCLENGGAVIVGVDSSEVWEGMDNDLFGPGMDADHAVQVIGIDRSNPEQPMVILNDPGAANGGGAMLPLDVFVGAWEDSGCFMVEAYA